MRPQTHLVGKGETILRQVRDVQWGWRSSSIPTDYEIWPLPADEASRPACWRSPHKPGFGLCGDVRISPTQSSRPEKIIAKTMIDGVEGPWVECFSSELPDEFFHLLTQRTSRCVGHPRVVPSSRSLRYRFQPAAWRARFRRARWLPTRLWPRRSPPPWRACDPCSRAARGTSSVRGSGHRDPQWSERCAAPRSLHPTLSSHRTNGRPNRVPRLRRLAPRSE